MVDFISECFDLLEVPERSRARLESRVRQYVAEYGIDDSSQIYRYIVSQIELKNTPYRERFFTHLDTRPFEDGRMFHEVIAAAPDEPELVSRERLPSEYQKLFDALSGFLPGIALDTLVDLPLAPVSVVRERLEILEEKAKQSTYLVSPLRPVKRAYFDAENEFHLVLGRRPNGFDALALYHEYYEGLSRGELDVIDHGIYNTLKRRGLLDALPRKRRKSGYDSWEVYMAEFPGATVGFLRCFEPVLYRKLSQEGHLHKVPKSKRKSYFLF